VKQKLIYVLKDPTDMSVRYVGCTSADLRQRLSVHISPAALDQRIQNPRVAWLRSLLRKGLKPIIEAVETVPPNESWQDAEIRTIAMFRSMGESLTNSTDGGLGVRGCYPSEQTRKKRSLTLKERYAKNPDQMERRQEMARNAGRGDASRDVASKRMAAIWADPALAEQMRARMRGARSRKRMDRC
jgi:hypothetical protein